MCIICNLTKATDKFPDVYANVDKADRFLIAFRSAAVAMETSAKAMRDCAQVERRYDKTHKQMVKLCREWNALEQSREAGAGEAQHQR